MASYYAMVALFMLAIAISAGYALDDKKLQTTLYIKQSYTQDQRGVAPDTVIINWVLKDGPDAAASTIGHAEGLAIYAYQGKPFWVTIMDMVFEGGSLTGSSLKVMGLTGSIYDGQGQWSVMGGTGQLPMARGIINYKIIQEDGASRTFEISLHVYYSSTTSFLGLGGTGILP